MQIKTIIPALMVSALIILSGCNNNFKLQDGDLLFAVDKDETELVNAIKSSTSVEKGIPFSHVGIVKIEDENVYVIEATTSDGVIKTLLYNFMQKAAKLKGEPIIAVGRVNPQYSYLVSKAIENAEESLATPYDFAYDETNDQLYCSELIRFAYVDSTGNPIFEPLAMSFKNKKTGETEPYWIQHFQKLGEEVPEGKPGTNPADMAKSPVIKIVHTYY